MVDLTDAAIDAALARGADRRRAEARALTAQYSAQSGKVMLELESGVAVAIPADLVEGLATASEAARANIRILGGGYALSWPDLDLDMTVPGLMAGILGTASHMARLAGQVRSEAKAGAARANGARGGRPRKGAA